MLDKAGFNSHVTELQASIHDGMAFSFSQNGILTPASELVFVGVTGMRQVHFDAFGVEVSQGKFLLEFYENPILSNDGTLLTQTNRNRNSSTIPTFKISHTPTISSNGTKLDSSLVVATSHGNNRVPGLASIEEGWVLKSNTKYMIKLINQSGETISYNANFIWHEANYEV